MAPKTTTPKPTVSDELTEKIASSFAAFVPFAWPIIKPGTDYLHNWHVDCIAEHLEAVTAGEIRHLVINIPPRAMKSTLVTIMWPVWEWLSEPTRRSLAVDQFTKHSNGTYFSVCKDCNRHVFGQRRRARLKSVGGSYTTSQWEELVAQYERCPLCLRLWEEIPPHPSGSATVTVDHIVPISKGGSNSIENLQPLYNTLKSVRDNQRPCWRIPASN